jgi:hypothetical protein
VIKTGKMSMFMVLARQRVKMGARQLRFRPWVVAAVSELTDVADDDTHLVQLFRADIRAIREPKLHTT